MKRHINITIEEEQLIWCRENRVNISQLTRDMIEESRKVFNTVNSLKQFEEIKKHEKTIEV